MGMISFPREGYGGITRTQRKIEEWFYNSVKGRIITRLQSLWNERTDIREKCVVRYLKQNLRKIILSNPEELLSIMQYILRHYLGVFDDRNAGSFNKRVLWAFGYDDYRKTNLVRLAKWLDIKTCPYCNSHYTLFLDVKGIKNHPNGLAKFQFDHFLNKGDAPFLSMSLYNLIPSCAVCNSLKSDIDWPIELNPYVSDINSLYEFRVTKPFRLWTGAKLKGNIKIKMAPTEPRYRLVVEKLDKDVCLSKRYGRHADVAQDVFERAYTYPYYSDSQNFSNMLTHLDEEKFKRIWMGASTQKSEIEKQPLTKFKQDLWEQANSELGR